MTAAERLCERLWAEWLRACSERDQAELKLAEALKLVAEQLKHLEAARDALKEHTAVCTERDKLKDEIVFQRSLLATSETNSAKRSESLTNTLRLAEAERDELAGDLKALRLRDAKAERHELLLTPVTEIDLSMRAENCLEHAGIKLVGELMQLSHQDLTKIPGMGRATLRDIESRLKELGLTLGSKVVDLELARQIGEIKKARSQ